MFYEPKHGHPLPHNPFKACVAPRPIGWISTVSRGGIVNLAPFSYFNAVLDDPPTVMFSASGAHLEGPIKDTALNARETGEFVYNMATWDLRTQMNQTSASVPRHIDEFDLAHLARAPSHIVKPPRVAASPVQFECKTIKILELSPINTIVFGEVVGIHIDERIVTGGRIDLAKAMPIARLGYMEYSVVREIFEMNRP
ncbi:MAG: flavin reductase family protein [Bryobacterales bacterium]|nr:flavin reductase family protein [Bryobacterales bacterium]